MEQILDSSRTRPEQPPSYLQDIREIMEEGTTHQKTTMKKDFVSVAEFINFYSKSLDHEDEDDDAPSHDSGSGSKASSVSGDEGANDDDASTTTKQQQKLAEFASVAPCIRSYPKTLENDCDFCYSTHESEESSSSDLESDTSSVTSGSENSGSDDNSSIATSEICLKDFGSTGRVPVAKPKPKTVSIMPREDVQVMDAAKKAIERCEGTSVDEKNQEDGKIQQEDEDSSCSSGCPSEYSRYSNESEKYFNGDDDDDEEESAKEEDLKVKSKEIVAPQASSRIDFASEIMVSKHPDQKRLVHLEQTLADAEDMIAGLVDEANAQHKEREIAVSMLANAREKIAEQTARFCRLQIELAKKGDTIFALQSKMKEQKQQQAGEKAKYENRLKLSDGLLSDAYDEIEEKQQQVAALESSVNQLKADQIKQDVDKIETVCRLEEAHKQEIKLLRAQNAAMKGSMAGLQRNATKLQSQVKILKAKFVLQEHLAKVESRKHESTKALFDQMKQRLVERIESLDHHSNVLSTRLEQHLKTQKRQSVQQELLEIQLQEANKKLHHFQNAARSAGNEKQVIAQVVHKERVKSDLRDTYAKRNPSEKVIHILERDLDQLQKQSKEVAEKKVISLQAKLRFAKAKESLLGKTLSIKNADNMEQEDRLKEMSEKLASLRSDLCLKQSENELLVAKLKDWAQKQQQPKFQPESGAQSASDSLEFCGNDNDNKMKPKSPNRKVNSLEAELSLLKFPELIVTDARLIDDSWSGSEEGNAADSDSDDGDMRNHDAIGVMPTEGDLAELVSELANEDEEEWDFLSHSSPVEQDELWC